MINQTKQALEASLKHLLLQKPLDKITISDLTKDCGISRMAFYYHFKDIYDLVEWSCLEDAKRALDEKKTYETWQQALDDICHGLDISRPVILPRHERDWEQFGLTHFLPEHFLESVHFDKLELQYIDPDKKKKSNFYAEL